MTRVLTKVREKIVSKVRTMQSGQRVRLQRLGMALVTYAVVTLMAILVTRLGLGEMSTAQWVTFVGLGLFGNTGLRDVH